MNDKLLHSEVYTIANTNNFFEKSYNYNDEVNETFKGGKKACRREKKLKIYRRKNL
jgi:hypothetical protein